jgi:hypothetical protein
MQKCETGKSSMTRTLGVKSKHRADYLIYLQLFNDARSVWDYTAQNSMTVFFFIFGVKTVSHTK